MDTRQKETMMRLKTHSLRNGTATLAVAALMAATVGVASYISTPSGAAQASTAHRHGHANTRSREAVTFLPQLTHLVAEGDRLAGPRVRVAVAVGG